MQRTLWYRAEEAWEHQSITQFEPAKTANFAEWLCIPEQFEPKAVFLDMDGTCVLEETIVELATLQGCREEVDRVTQAAMRGELDFTAALRQRVALLKGMSQEKVAQVYQTMTWRRGLGEFASYCDIRGIPLYLVSGGFLPVARQLAHALNCRGVHANELGAKDGKLSGDLDGIIVDATSKAEFTRANRAAKGNVAVGDGANDIPMLQAVEWAIGMEPKPLVRPVVEGILDDFRGLTLVFKQIQ